MGDFLRQGLDLVTKATEHDANKRIKEALYLYKLSVQYLQQAFQAEASGQTRTILSQKINEYTSRIYQLQSQLQSSSTTTAPVQPNIPIDQQVQKLQIQNTPTSPPSNTNTLSTPKQQEMVSAPPSIDWSSLQQAEKAKWSGENESAIGDLVSNLENALQNIESASFEDARGNYDTSLQYYQTALDFFQKAIEAEKNPKLKADIKEQMTQYVTRAEAIKQIIKTKTPTSKQLRSNSDATPTPTPTGTQRLRLEVSPAAAKSLEEAINLATEAVDLDDCGKLDDAINNYTLSIASFTLALKSETNSGVKNMIREKMTQYSMRIEQLNNFKSSGTVNPGAIPMGRKNGEKYKPPEIQKKKSLGKKTWQ